MTRLGIIVQKVNSIKQNLHAATTNEPPDGAALGDPGNIG